MNIEDVYLNRHLLLFLYLNTRILEKIRDFLAILDN